jgi:hypothetical protein
MRANVQKNRTALTALIAVATMFTLGRSAVIAYRNTHLTSVVMPAAKAAAPSVIRADIAGPDLFQVDAMLSRRDPLVAGGARSTPPHMVEKKTPAAMAATVTTRNPHKRAVETSSAVDPRTLSLVSVSGDYAILRDASGTDRVVRMGQMFSGYTVRRIDADRVTLAADDREIIIFRHARRS